MHRTRRRAGRERAPEDRFRHSIERTGRPLKVQVAWLLTTFGHTELDAQARASIERRLTLGGFRVSPSMEEAEAHGTVTLHLIQPEEVVRRSIERTGRPLKVQMEWLREAFGQGETPAGIERRLREAGFRVSPSLREADIEGTAMLYLAKPGAAGRVEGPDGAEGGHKVHEQGRVARSQATDQAPRVAELERMVSELEQSLADARAQAERDRVEAQARIDELERRLESRELFARDAALVPADEESEAPEDSGESEHAALDTFFEAKRAAAEARAAIEQIQSEAKSRKAAIDRGHQPDEAKQGPARD